MDLQAELAQARQYMEQGRLGQAKLSYRIILRAVPDNAEANSQLGRVALSEGDLASAARLQTQAAESAPNNPDIRRDLGDTLLRLRQFAKAAAEFERALEINPESADDCQRLGQALRLAGDSERAEKAFRRALAIEPEHMDTRLNFSTLLILTHHYHEAVELLEPALVSSPDDPAIMLGLASAYERISRNDEADELASRLIARFPSHGPAAMIKARQEARRGDIDAGIKRLEQVVSGNFFRIESYRPLFDLAKLLDRKGDYDQAFKTFEMANHGQRASYAKGPETDLGELVSAFHEWFNAERVAAWGPPPSDGIKPPVFFVGFPRSGTTLVETILGAHPDIVTTGEAPLISEATSHLSVKYGNLRSPETLDALTEDDITAARRAYMDSAARVTGTDLQDKLVLDKLPLNLAHLPLINRIFPDSRLLVALRDPRDVSLSCFMQSFGMNRGMWNFLDLEMTATFYAAIMGFWLSARQVTSMDWMEYRYEDLVDDFDGTTRNILDFVGVAQDENITPHDQHARQVDISTPSYDSVSQPINKGAIERWRNYAEPLAPILPILEPFVKEFGYEPS